jgi:hypothetical protein
MAAGAILPPLFFEPRLHASMLLATWHSQEHPKNTIASITRLNGRRIQARPISDLSPPKDI